MQNVKLSLIGTSHCHLCEEAALIIEEVIKTKELESKVVVVNQIDIIHNDTFYELYATKIPVLKIEENLINNVIFWPFTKQCVIDLINRT